MHAVSPASHLTSFISPYSINTDRAKVLNLLDLPERVARVYESTLAGPFLNYGEQTDDLSTWCVSMMIGVRESTELPRVSATCLPGRIFTPRSLGHIGGMTFLRYDFKVLQLAYEQKVSYMVNDKVFEFFVPKHGAPAKLMFSSCNGYQNAKDKIAAGGIQPMWQKAHEEHLKQPFHLMIENGDKVYCDGIIDQEDDTGTIAKGVFALPSILKWLVHIDPESIRKAPFTEEMQQEVTEFYLNYYCRHLSQNSYAEMLASVPSISNWDDHDIFDGWGSYPDYLQNSFVFQGIFCIALQFYLLFQHHTTMDMAREMGYLGEKGYSFIRPVDNGKLVLLGLDTRSERTPKQVISPQSWEAIFQSLDTIPPQCQHLIILVGIPVVYPSFNEMVKLIDIAGKEVLIDLIASYFPGIKNQFNLWDIKEDGIDHWSYETHTKERNYLIERLQEFAAQRQLRVSFFSGDVHNAGLGLIYPKACEKLEADPKTMWQVISSPIGNIPPPKIVSFILTGLARDCISISNIISAKLIPVPSKQDRSDHDLIIDKRNYVVACRNENTHALEVEWHVEQNLGAAQQTDLKIYAVAIPAIAEAGNHTHSSWNSSKNCLLI